MAWLTVASWLQSPAGGVAETRVGGQARECGFQVAGQRAQGLQPGEGVVDGAAIGLGRFAQLAGLVCQHVHQCIGKGIGARLQRAQAHDRADPAHHQSEQEKEQVASGGTAGTRGGGLAGHAAGSGWMGDWVAR